VGNHRLYPEADGPQRTVFGTWESVHCGPPLTASVRPLVRDRQQADTSDGRWDHRSLLDDPATAVVSCATATLDTLQAAWAPLACVEMPYRTVVLMTTVNGGAIPSANLQEKSMMRQIFWIPLCALLLALGVPIDAQQPKKISRVGYLAAVSAAADAPRLEAFRQGLRDLGYIEGQNIIIE